MSNRLYYLIATDPDGNNRDLAVVGEGLKGAFDQWEAYFHPDAQDLRDEGETPGHDYCGIIHEVGEEQRLTVDEDGLTSIGINDADLRIYEVSTDLTAARPLAWHSNDMMLVGYLTEGEVM